MRDTRLNRRTAMKLASAGLVGSVLLPGNAMAGNGDLDPDAAVLLVDIFVPEVGIERFKNVTEDPRTGRTLETRGAVVFEVGASDALGGGPFTLRDANDTVEAEGLWTADRVKKFTPYDSNQRDHPAPFPDAWKGGLIKLKTSFEPEIPGVTGGNMTIECHIGTDSEDDKPKFDTQGVRVDHYDEVVAFGTLFNHSADLE